MLDGRPEESTIVNGVEVYITKRWINFMDDTFILKVLMALLEIRRPTPQAGGFYQYTMSEEQVENIILNVNFTIFQ